jgi:hypothetical protein
MNTFANAVNNTPVKTKTTNGMAAYKSTMRANVDLFGQIGAMRGKDVTGLFNKALVEDSELAIRIALWARDIRGGAGERKLFRDILLHLEKVNPDYLTKTNLLSRVPDLGRFDDLLVFNTEEVKSVAFSLIQENLQNGNGLAAKWMPRKGAKAVELRNFMAMSPKQYRKLLVNLTRVVETQMCNREFEAINFNHVPSLAMSRYTKAFAKKAPTQFTAYKEALKRGDKGVKVNAGAVYPYDIIKTVRYGDSTVANAQWDALPNFIGDANVLPLVDVSGSMGCRAGGGTKGVDVTCLDVAISLGLYCASKNTGKFKDMFLTFSSEPEFVTVKGTLSQRYNAMARSSWNMSTDLEKALHRILDTAVKGKVPAAEMPTMLLIMSDMQFNQCVGTGGGGWSSSAKAHDPRAIEMIRNEYRRAGYEAPAVVFWNLNSHGNVPVSFDETGTALVSGFSPAIMKAVLGANYDDMTPEGIMRKTVMQSKYDFR